MLLIAILSFIGGLVARTWRTTLIGVAIVCGLLLVWNATLYTAVVLSEPGGNYAQAAGYVVATFLFQAAEAGLPAIVAHMLKAAGSASASPPGPGGNAG